MKFLLMIYPDQALMDTLPQAEYDARMHHCIKQVDELRDSGRLLDTQQLEEPHTAKSVRHRDNKISVLDGPFAETKEYLGGFQLIEAEDMDEAVRIASDIPWTKTGCVEIRPVRDLEAVRRRVGA